MLRETLEGETVTHEKPKGPPWEQAAEQKTVTGWACKTCGRFCGEGAAGERADRYCHASDAPCKCGRRRKFYESACQSCRDKYEAKKYAGLEEVEWDGETPLVGFRNDHYIWNVDELVEYLDGCEVQVPLDDPDLTDDEFRAAALEETRLCLCRQVEKPEFELAEFLWDYDPEAEINDDGKVAEKAVNDWLAKYRVMWVQDNKRPSLDSLKKALGIGE